MLVTFVSPVTSISAAIFVVNEAHFFNTMDLHSQLDILQDHLVIMHATGQSDDIEIVVPKTDRDPWLEKFLKTIVHAMDDKGVTMNDGFFDWHVFL